ncbi:hypothetical protein QAD02_011279, partial [Eretmocerus hayati]
VQRKMYFPSRTNRRLDLILSFIFVIPVSTRVIENEQNSCFEFGVRNVKPFTTEFRVWADSKSRNFVENLTKYDENFIKSRFKPTLPTYVIIHGFWENYGVSWVKEMKDILLEREKSNVILVDWSSAYSRKILKLSLLNFDALDYTGAILSTKLAANQINTFLREISRVCDTPLDKWRKLHFIGHSLGAHIAGQAARNLRDVTQVHRITGLDPAGPCFEGVNTNFKLNRLDAGFVDVIHTNCDPHQSNNLGITEPLGTIDFYPNGGNHQPNCEEPIVEAVGSFLEKMGAKRFIASGVNSWQLFFHDSKTDFQELTENILTRGWNLVCDHQESIEYFMQSLREPGKKFLASPLLDETSVLRELAYEEQTNTMCVEMGINADDYSDARGIYYLDTTNELPECNTS